MVKLSKIAFLLAAMGCSFSSIAQDEVVSSKVEGVHIMAGVNMIGDTFGDIVEAADGDDVTFITSLGYTSKWGVGLGYSTTTKNKTGVPKADYMYSNGYISYTMGNGVKFMAGAAMLNFKGVKEETETGVMLGLGYTFDNRTMLEIHAAKGELMGDDISHTSILVGYKF